MNSKTVEINNTDAEGRLVLADCIAHAIAEGAERVIDLATLTGAALVALGHTYAALLSNDDELVAALTRAGDATGEIVWRLPLHAEYKKLVRGTVADLNNAPERGLAGTILGAEFLAAFAGETPWAHLDIAGTAWSLGRAYAEKGAPAGACAAGRAGRRIELSAEYSGTPLRETFVSACCKGRAWPCISMR